MSQIHAFSDIPVAVSGSTIRDNHKRGAVGDFLRGAIQPDSQLSIVSAYFTIYAYEALRESLDPIAGLRFLFGEPRFIEALDPDRDQKKAFHINKDEIQLSNQLRQKQIARDCARWIEDKVEIRSIRQANFLHGKMYHIGNPEEQAILGSSNFTVRGLGLAKGCSNIELNLVVDSKRDLVDLKAWFNDVWNDTALVEDVKQKVLQSLAKIYENHAPEFIYFKTLYHIFEQYLSGDSRVDADLQRSTLFDSKIWQSLFAFQKDGVKGAINKILAHNGCILADSVGLGKTYEALAVIKYFELRNERVLVLCPKKLAQNWTVYRHNSRLNPLLDDKFRYDVLSHTDLGRERGEVNGIKLNEVNWSNYDLVVIDESHNFRNNTPPKKTEPGELPKLTRYQRLMEKIIKEGVRTKVLLLSATPVNNSLRDLRNQIVFISAGEESAFMDSIGIPSVADTLKQAQLHFTLWSKEPANQRSTKELLGRLGTDFFKLLDELTIARSRKHVMQFYSHEMDRLGRFPKRKKPLTITPEIDAKGRFLSYDKLSQEIDQYKLSLFNPSAFVRPEHRAEYDKKLGNFTQAQREKTLIGMMKVNFLKRLESSVCSFALTLERTIAKIEGLEKRLVNFRQYQDTNPLLDLATVTAEELDDDELADALEVGKALKFKTAHLQIDEWLQALQFDKRQLNGLYLEARDVSASRDLKLDHLKKLIREKALHPTTNRDGKPNRKVLVFTAFADTADYLYENLHEWAYNELKIHAALVVGSGKNKTFFQPAELIDSPTDFNTILTNFSPISKQRDKRYTVAVLGEIDLLIATDCISEGQNLQDCDYLVNYDIHWNPVRIIQRFGRIDRIGSRNDSVQLVNFWPTDNLDQYISLKHRVEARMALADIAATQEDNLLQPEEIEDLITDELKYRNQQLKRLRDEVLDLEDLDDSVNLTDFTLDDFRTDLLNYLETNRKILEEAPYGLYSCAPAESDLFRKVHPGVIFCLRQQNAGTGPRTEQINPLQPYYLVYVMNDGNVRYGFGNPKQILDLYRSLCAGRTAAYEDLCTLFDTCTKDGTCMDIYNDLLERAVGSITSTYRRKLATGLQSSRSFIIPAGTEQASDVKDFELITWLVISSNE